MSLALIGFGVITLLELLLWTPPLWRWRRTVASILIVTLSVDSGYLAGTHFILWTGLILVFSVYRMVNLLRLAEARIEPDRLLRAARRTSLWLMGCQAVILALAWVSLKTAFGVYILAGSQLVTVAVIVGSTRRHLRTTRPPATVPAIADRDLPTLSVCVPARNETQDLEACLASLVSSTYPKLEILVLDDCSQNKRTPEIIRSFAASGVRFIDGKVPPQRWLAKNYAYKQLADEASGDMVLFCGVDTRFKPGSLRQMVEVLLAKRKTMLSILPKNNAPVWNLPANLVQPSRYAWEISLPRRALQRPPVVSTCWLITAKALQAAGGLDAVDRAASPESYFARSSASHQDGYSFLQSDDKIGLTSTKSLFEQRATAIRTRYPQIHKRPELVALLSLAELATLIAPFALFLGGLLAHSWWLVSVSALACVGLVYFYAAVSFLTYRRFLWRSLWLEPFAAVYDICLLNYSMWQYEFNQVIWKGRNVCIPVMQMGTPKTTSDSAQKR